MRTVGIISLAEGAVGGQLVTADGSASFSSLFYCRLLSVVFFFPSLGLTSPHSPFVSSIALSLPSALGVLFIIHASVRAIPAR